jgi:hypothetical protein
MAHPYHHALSSVKKWGGKVEDYIAIHEWFDESKKILADFRHRALRHRAEGIFMAETVLGRTINCPPAASSRPAGGGRAAHHGGLRPHPLIRRLGPGHQARSLDGPVVAARSRS